MAKKVPDNVLGQSKEAFTSLAKKEG